MKNSSGIFTKNWLFLRSSIWYSETEKITPHGNVNKNIDRKKIETLEFFTSFFEALAINYLSSNSDRRSKENWILEVIHWRFEKYRTNLKWRTENYGKINRKVPKDFQNSDIQWQNFRESNVLLSSTKYLLVQRTMWKFQKF